MSDKSQIGWTNSTWNTIYGCSKVSLGCRHCYAMKEAHIHKGHPNPSIAGRYEGLTKLVGGSPEWTNMVRLWPNALTVPLKWKKPRRVFVNSQSDTFHPDVPFDYIDKIFAVMALCPQHTFQVLTKRPERMAEYLGSHREAYIHQQAQELWPEMHGENAYRWSSDRVASNGEPQDYEYYFEYTGAWPLHNVWLGTSCEDQKTADERIPHLLSCPAAVLFLSCEPLIGRIDLCMLPSGQCDPANEPVRTDGLHRYVSCLRPHCFDPFYGWNQSYLNVESAQIHWVIAGAESGKGRMPADPKWFRSLRDQCAAAAVPFFLKQMEADGKIVHDADIFPEDLRIQQFPISAATTPRRLGTEQGTPPVPLGQGFPSRGEKPSSTPGSKGPGRAKE